MEKPTPQNLPKLTSMSRTRPTVKMAAHADLTPGVATRFYRMLQNIATLILCNGAL